MTETTNSYEIKGVLQLITPLHVAAPENGWRYNPANGGQIVIGDDKQPPCTRTQRLPCLARSEDISDQFSGRFGLPIVFSNNIRNRLRRATASILSETLIQRGQSITLDIFHVLQCGAASGNPDKRPLTIDEFNNVRNHFFMGIFAGGPKMVPSTLVTDSLYPITESSLNLGLVPVEYSDMQVPEPCTGVIMTTRTDDVLRFSDNNAPLVIKDYHEAVDLWREETTSKTGDDDITDTKTKKRGLRSWTAHEVVRPGTTMYLNMKINSTREPQLGLLIRGLRRLLSGPIGGLTRYNYGKFKVLDGMYIKDTSSETAEKIPLFVSGLDTLQINEEHETIKSWLAACDEALAEMTPESLETVTMLENGKAA